jgi:putative membrane protein
MYRGDWNDHMGYGRGIFMVLICAALIGLVVWLVLSTSRRHHPAPVHPQMPLSSSNPTTTAPPSAQQILDERLARGEIEVDDYRARLEALRTASNPPTS